jgi:uncharacterized membrane protein
MDGAAAVFEVGSGSYTFALDAVLGSVGDATEKAEALRALVAPLNATGAADARRWTEEIQASLREAWEARVSGDGQKEATRAVQRALADLDDIRRWLDKGTVSAADAAAVRSLLDRIASDLSKASGTLLAVAASIEFPAEQTFPGSTMPVTIAVKNGGAYPVTAPTATLKADTGWPVRAVGDKPTVVAPGETARFRFEVPVPADAASGKVQLTGAVSYTYRHGTATLPVSAAASVAAPVTVDSVTLSPAKAEPGATLTASVKLTNHAGDLTRRLTLEVPEGWTAPAAVSYTAAAGATVTVPVRIDVPQSVTEGDATIAAVVGASAAERGTAKVTITVATAHATVWRR